MGNVGHEVTVNKLAQTGRLIERKASRQAEGRVTEILFNTVQGANQALTREVEAKDDPLLNVNSSNSSIKCSPP